MLLVLFASETLENACLVVASAASHVLSEINDLLFNSCSLSEEALAAAYSGRWDSASRSIADYWIDTREQKKSVQDLKRAIVAYRDVLAVLCGTSGEYVLHSANCAAVLSAYARTALPCPVLPELVTETKCSDLLDVDPSHALLTAEYLAPGKGAMFLCLIEQCHSSSVVEVLKAALCLAPNDAQRRPTYDPINLPQLGSSSPVL